LNIVSDCDQEKRKYFVECSRRRHASTHEANEKLSVGGDLGTPAVGRSLAAAKSTKRAPSVNNATAARDGRGGEWNTGILAKSGLGICVDS
jgi:hypothetical protein